MSNLADFLDDDSFDKATANARPDPVPAGEYQVEMQSYEFKPTANDDGVMLNCVFKITDGEYENRQVYAGYCIKHTKAQTQSIAMGQVVSMCEAMGITKDDFKHDTSSALYVPVMAKLKITPERTDPKTGKTYDARNEISGYKPVGSPSASTAPASKPSAAAASVPAAKPAPAAIGGAKKLVWNKAKPAESEAAA